MKKNNQLGFNIIELIIVLVLIAILAILMMPVYKNYITKTNRSDAIRSLLNTQIQVEKYRVNNTSYANTSAFSSMGGLYTITVSGASATTYTITASTNPQQNDPDCPTLTITYNNGTSTMTPTACWNQ